MKTEHYIVAKLDPRPSIGSVLIKNETSGVDYVVEMEREPYYLLKVRGEEELSVGDKLQKIASLVIDDGFIADVDEIMSEENTKFKVEGIQ